ncbi:hypothetical protein, partial [Pseudoalteromonas sp. Q18-MNA-CIBAN-0097]|uniref:hypothetical protein n=1 Tax=Pseudoalteromonas sp. Q18-MNA-CIBAN-0097 TaxID=3140440 RepID=UPI00331D5FC6
FGHSCFAVHFAVVGFGCFAGIGCSVALFFLCEFIFYWLGSTFQNIEATLFIKSSKLFASAALKAW